MCSAFLRSISSVVAACVTILVFCHVVNSRAAEQVQFIIQTLPERDQEVLTCRFLVNHSIRETAARMGLTETNIKVV